MAAFEYKWRIDGLHKVSAAVAGNVCEQLEKSEVGLSPETLLEASRDASAPLHGEFEWNDDVAAEEWRRHQARSIIQQLDCICVHEGGETVERAFVNVRPNPAGAYVALQSALTNDAWHAHLLEQAKRDGEAFRNKYKRLEELSAVIADLGEFLDA